MVEDDLAIFEVFGPDGCFGLFDTEKSILSVISSHATRYVHSFLPYSNRSSKILQSDEYAGPLSSYGPNGYRIDVYI